MHPLRWFAASVALLVVSSGCESGRIDPPERFTGFPSQSFEGIVFAEARYYLNHADIFDDDLIEEEGLVPIALKIGLRGEGQETAQYRIAPDDMEFSLHLLDGTLLQALDYRKIQPGEDVGDVVAMEALKGTLLESWERTREGFVFFRLPEGVEYSEELHSIVIERGDQVRSLDLAHSLCSFRVTIGNRLVPFHVGVQLDTRASGSGR